ncbi:MAG: translation initiation factor [Microscillaceae bacterium]|nr:translation initiation factor [Microscillaceae bacterium]MDW8460239.1 translation initiation factor [Cytophagales bacterium]
MAKKRTPIPKEENRIVYSTNPDFVFSAEEQIETPTLPNNLQNLRVVLDKKARHGKQVTLVTGFVGTQADLEHLARKLKNLCGVGGTVKNQEILIQGDTREKILAYLLKEGYKAKT